MKKVVLILFVIMFFCGACYSMSSKTHAQVYQGSLILPFKDISHNIRVINKIKNQARNLYESDKYVLRKYIIGAVKGENTFLLINCNLRGNLKDYISVKEITKPLHYRLTYYSDNLYNVISKTSLPQNMILYQNVNEKEIKLIFPQVKECISKSVNQENLKIMQEKLNGKKYTEKGFMLVSYDKSDVIKPKIMFELQAPKNLNAVLLYELGQDYTKKILINRDTSWEVSNISIETDKKNKSDYYKIKFKYVIQ